MRFALTFLCVIIVAGTAEPGAWSREKGQAFVASGSNILLSDGAELPVHYDPTLYAEYGLTELITIGLDYHTADKGRIDTGFVFVGFPLGDKTTRSRFAANIGFGARVDEHNPAETLFRGGLSWGRNLETGWLAIDATATRGAVDQVFRPKVDATWGRNWTDRWSTTLQLQTGQGFAEEHYAKISPSVIFALNKSTSINLGAVGGLTGDRGGALKLELWTTY